MMTEQCEHFIDELTRRTVQNEIDWKLLSQFSFEDNGFPDFVDNLWNVLNCNEFRWLLKKNSFFTFHKEGIIALLRIENESGFDSSKSTEYAIIVQMRPNSPEQDISRGYHQDALSILYMAVLDYLNKDTSLPGDLYDFMRF